MTAATRRRRDAVALPREHARAAEARALHHQHELAAAQHRRQRSGRRERRHLHGRQRRRHDRRLVGRRRGARARERAEPHGRASTCRSPRCRRRRTSRPSTRSARSSTRKACRSSTCRTRRPTATASCSSAAPTSSPPATCSTWTRFRSSTSTPAAASTACCEGLNAILKLAIPEFRTEGGTMVIPGHGRLGDSADVGYYRDMLTIIRDQVQALIDEGLTLEQVIERAPDVRLRSALRHEIRARGRPRCSSRPSIAA